MSDIFKDKSSMPEKPANPSVQTDNPMPMLTPLPEPMVVRVAQTMREYNNHDRVYSRDAIDVQNLRRPRFGHGY